MKSISSEANSSQEQKEVSTLSKEKVKRSLKNSILDGSAAAAMQGLTLNYTTPFALILKATTTQIGLLSSVPNFMMSIAQLAAPGISERIGSRKSLILIMGFLHALMWLPILFIPYVFSKDQVFWLIGFLSLTTTFDAAAQPAWGSMMADLVPEEVRGRFFGNRNRIMGIINLVFSYIAAGILEVISGDLRLAFAIIFAGATASRLVSFYFLSRMDEPPSSTIVKKVRVSILEISKTLPSTNVGKFMIYCALLNFSLMLAGPFFSPFMLTELKFSYIIYSIINSVSGLSVVVFMTWWGRRIDRAGNIRILKITGFLIAFSPIAWVINHHFWWLIFVQICSGFIWAGFQLSTTLFIYDASPPENRTRYIALYNSLVFLGLSMGSLTGGILAPLLPTINGSHLLSIFLVSGMARLLTAIMFLPHISEVRNVPEFTNQELLMEGIKPEKLKEMPRKITDGIFQRIIKIFKQRK